MHYSSSPTARHQTNWRALFWAGKRRFVTIGVAAVVFLVLLWAVLLMAANVVAGGYQTQLKTYRSGVTSQLDRASQQIGDASSDTAGLTKVQQTLQGLQKGLSSKAQGQPKLAFVPLGPVLSGTYKTAQTQRTAIQNAMSDLTKAVDDLTTFSTYNQQLSVVLAPVISQKSLVATNYATEQTVWQTAATKLGTITPPKDLKATHDKLKSTLADNATLWQQLDAAYKATDIPKFNDLQSKLGQATMVLMQQATTFRQYQSVLQQRYNAAYAALIKV